MKFSHTELKILFGGEIAEFTLAKCGNYISLQTQNE